MFRLIQYSRRNRSIYQIYKVEKNVESGEIFKKIDSTASKQILSKEDELEVKKFVLDPLKYRMELELKNGKILAIIIKK